MLSISPVINSSKAGNYFDSDNYYAKDDPEAKKLSGWWGKTAEALGLSGEIDREQFVSLLNGKMPNGEQLGILKDGQYQHRNGYDLTFSAPKSVSLMLEVGGDKRLLTAHDNAVNAALAQIESDLASARITKKGETTIEQTGNLAVAKFLHDTSRALDPQLHTHAVVLNATIREDGKIRSLGSQSHSKTQTEGKAGFMEQLFDNKLYYGSLYRAQLAYEVNQLGYEINKTHRDGRFELAGIDKTILQHFSKRRTDIEQAMETHGLEGGKDAAYATILTRANKQNVSHDELRMFWQQEAKSVGFEPKKILERANFRAASPEKSVPDVVESEKSFAFDALVEHLKTKFQQLLGWCAPDQSEFSKLTAIEKQENLAKEAVAYAAAHLSERNAAFSLKEVIQIAHSHSLGNVSPKHIQQAVNDALADKILLKTAMPQNTAEYGNMRQNAADIVTTQAAVDLERDTIAQMSAGQGQRESLVCVHRAEMALQALSLNTEQYQAALTILTSQDSVIGIQGYAGTGKTTMLSNVKKVAEEDKQTFLSAVKTVAEESGIIIRGMAPSAAAASQLEQGAGISSQTLESFLIDMQREKQNSDSPQSKQLWILDEASMASSRQMNELLKYTNSQGAQLVAVGDTMQLGAVEAGKPFEQLQHAGMQTVTLKNIQRQKNPELLQAVYSSIQGNIEQALKKIGDNVNEIKNKDERLNAVARAWLALTPDERKNTLVITPVNEGRQVVNQLIREGLKLEGKIAQFGEEVKCYQSEGLTLIEKTRAINYTAGMVLRFNRDDTSHKIKRNSYLKVTATNPEKNQVHLKNERGKTVKWQPLETGSIRGAVEVFTPVKREISEGDVLRWTRNDKARGMINSQTASVISIEKHHATVRTQKGDLLSLDLRKNENRHWDYANAKTVYAAQGDTVKNVIAHDESFRKQLTNQRAFYVTISRAVEKATLFVDDKANYLNQLLTTDGQKISALEAIGESNQTQNKVASSHQAISPPEKQNWLDELSNSKQAVIKPLAKSSLQQHKQSQILRTALSHQPTKPHYDKETVREAMHHNIAYVVEKLLGQPNPKLSKPNEWRYGKKGSLVVTTEGKNQGKWKSFEGGGGKQGGDLFSLIEREMSTDFNGALMWAANCLGLSLTVEPTVIKRIQSNERTETSKEIPSHDDIKQISKARYLYDRAQPATGTLAETYLKTHRRINLDKLPDTIRFLPEYDKAPGDKRHPALIVKAENDKGEIQAVQLIYLDKEIGAKADIDVQKRQFGRMRFGAYVTLQDGKGDTVMIAEGVETALSIAQANPDKKVIATLSISNLNNVILPDETKNIIICADNDKGKEHAMASLATAIERFQEQSRTVSVAIPTLGEQAINADGSFKKVDFNDVHKELCIDAVKEQTSQAERVETKQKIIEPDSKDILKDLFKSEKHPVVPEPKMEIIATELMKELNKADDVNVSKTPSLSSGMVKALSALFSPDSIKDEQRNSAESLFYPSENHPKNHQKSYENEPKFETNRSDFSTDHTDYYSVSDSKNAPSVREKSISDFLPMESQKMREVVIERD